MSVREQPARLTLSTGSVTTVYQRRALCYGSTVQRTGVSDMFVVGTFV
jgi:hypothetical protein